MVGTRSERENMAHNYDVDEAVQRAIDQLTSFKSPLRRDPQGTRG